MHVTHRFTHPTTGKKEMVSFNMDNKLYAEYSKFRQIGKNVFVTRRVDDSKAGILKFIEEFGDSYRVSELLPALKKHVNKIHWSATEAERKQYASLRALYDQKALKEYERAKEWHIKNAERMIREANAVIARYEKQI